MTRTLDLLRKNVSSVVDSFKAAPDRRSANLHLGVFFIKPKRNKAENQHNNRRNEHGSVSTAAKGLDKRNIRSAEERADVNTGFGNRSRKKLVLLFYALTKRADAGRDDAGGEYTADDQSSSNRRKAVGEIQTKHRNAGNSKHDKHRLILKKLFGKPENDAAGYRRN